VSALLVEGDFLELGLGLYSTPILHKIAYEKNVKFHSVETDYVWAAKFKHYNLTKNHFVYVIMFLKDLFFILNQKMIKIEVVNIGVCQDLKNKIIQVFLQFFGL
jgi:hypothetical protein